MALVISDELIQLTGMTEEELRLEIAILLFRREKLTLAQASRFSGLARLELQKTLGSRRIPMHYDLDDLQDDLTALREVGLL